MKKITLLLLLICLPLSAQQKTYKVSIQKFKHHSYVLDNNLDWVLSSKISTFDVMVKGKKEINPNRIKGKVKVMGHNFMIIKNPVKDVLKINQLISIEGNAYYTYYTNYDSNNKQTYTIFEDSIGNLFCTETIPKAQN